MAHQQVGETCPSRRVSHDFREAALWHAQHAWDVLRDLLGAGATVRLPDALCGLPFAQNLKTDFGPRTFSGGSYLISAMARAQASTGCVAYTHITSYFTFLYYIILNIIKLYVTFIYILYHVQYVV